MAQSSRTHYASLRRCPLLGALLLFCLAGHTLHTATADAEKDSADIEEMLQMSVKEAQERTIEVINMADTNKDKKLDRAEAAAWVAQIKSWDHKKQVAEEFKSLDTDGDGYVSYDEMRVAYGPADGDDDTENQIKTRFSIVDVNKDNLLDVDEVGTLVDPSESPELLDLESRSIIKSQDKNGDGAIDFEEFIETENVSESERKEFQLEFKLYDINGDGKITIDEIKTVIIESSSNGDTQVSVLFADLEYITPDVVLANLKRYAVSPLTASGELLRFADDYSHLNLPFKSIEIPVGDDEEEEADDDGKDEL